jgi:hypothetical protein
MSKRKKKAPSRPKPSRSAFEDRRYASARPFTAKSWALTAQALGQHRDRTALLDLMGLFDWLGDRNLAAILRQLPPLPCRAGCAYCCRVGLDRPDLLPIEALRISECLRQEGSISMQCALDRIARRQEANAAATEEERANLPCLFLENDTCLIYPVRPLRCRAQHSHDANACQAHYVGQRETMPLLTEPALLYKSLQVGLRLGLQEAGLSDHRLPLTAAMSIVLAQADALDRWLRGKAIFASVALADSADEQRSLRYLYRQAQGQAQAEKRRLQQLTAILTQRRGAWAQYTVSGVSPI